jgi:hypothetical protein
MEPNKFSFYGCGITWSEQRDSLFTTTKIAAQRFDTYISTHSRFLRTRIVAGGSTNKFHTFPNTSVSTMIIFRCRWSGDEMCSDAFKPRPVVDKEGNEVPGLMEIDSQKVNKVRLVTESSVCMSFAVVISAVLRISISMCNGRLQTFFLLR